MRIATNHQFNRYQAALKTAQRFANTFGIDSIEALRAQRRANRRMNRLLSIDLANRQANSVQVQS
jgi:hypothetical protein